MPELHLNDEDRICVGRVSDWRGEHVQVRLRNDWTRDGEYWDLEGIVEGAEKFEYGTYEPGTLRLAVAILAACVPERVALAMAMRYARIVLARIDAHYWAMPVGAVRAWVVAHYPGQMPERARMAMRLMSAAM
ncbi:MAG: hypothetical protein HQ592_18570 [Planctomycetes bacterium]|nr:hypothetical protein [Planctomycetota bacterium]